MASFDIAITKTLANEGGAAYTETTGDTGGATKYGISQKSYPTLNIKALTEAEAKAIYKRDYWDKIKGDQIKWQKVASAIFDYAVNSGVSTAIKAAQEAATNVLHINVTVDGIMGPKTLEAINSCDFDHFNDAYALQKIAHYAAICNKNRDQSKFLLGWVNRTLREWML
jgi:lysozyme family protein